MQKAERVDRLLADANLVADLQAAGYGGREWQLTAEELARYGVDVLCSWIRKGTIYDKCAQKKRPVKRAPEGALTSDEIESIAGETVTRALGYFRDEVLRAGRWDPEKGASLTTFFVGQCILRFPDVYRPWLTSVESHRGSIDLAEVQLSQRLTPVEDDVMLSMMTSNALRNVRSDKARRAFVLCHYYGYTQVEAADQLGTTPKAVERALEYARRTLVEGRKESA
ncbi:sigma factor-like helix-turn-helix DNA-binding protein (plasmid) [Dermatophilaceae bacterium Soc4.6]